MVRLSPSAINEIMRLQASQNPASAFLRLSVQSSSCASFAYCLGFESEMQESDRLYQCHGIQVLVDAASAPYLAGITLDYSEDLMGGAFRFDNPNAVKTCGCGNAFSVDTDSTESL